MGETVAMHTPSFNRSVRIELRQQRLSSDGGAFLLRELLERSGIVDWLTGQLRDPRNPKLITYPLADLLRSVLLQYAQGWGDQGDVTSLRDDPALALTASSAGGLTPLEATRPSQPTLSRLLRIVSSGGNLATLNEAIMRLAGTRLRAMNRGRRPRELTIDIDGVAIPVYGEQAGSAYNTHLGGRVYYPLLASIAETGDLIGAKLRGGRAGPAAEAAEWIPAIVAAARAELCQSARVRLDAGFTDGATLAALEAEEIGYLGRLRSNPVLQRLAAPYLKRPPGRRPRDPREWVHEERYQARSWQAPRRVIVVVQEHPEDLFFHHFWLVTNLDASRYPAEKVLALYRRRGKAEGHFGELKDVLDPHLSSTCRGASTVAQVERRNEANLLLNVLAYQLMHLARALLERSTGEGWSLRRLRERVLKVGMSVYVHARQIRIAMARSAARFWAPLLRAIGDAQWGVP